jgi:hypothetical protein
VESFAMARTDARETAWFWAQPAVDQLRIHRAITNAKWDVARTTLEQRIVHNNPGLIHLVLATVQLDGVVVAIQNDVCVLY